MYILYLCKQYITTISISFIIIITVLEAKLINYIKQRNDHRVIAYVHELYWAKSTHNKVISI
jgi:hypothetical protein